MTDTPHNPNREWRAAKFFALRWNVHPKTANRWLTAFRAAGLPFVGNGCGRRYPVDLTEQMAIEMAGD